jgi:beta-lactamase superfamily II metal-dependent hydrolase
MRALFSFCLILISVAARADFLIVNRTGNLRQSPSTNSVVLQKVTTGDTLFLIDQIQVQGYYHVIALTSRQEGWIYRTLARRVAGDLAIDFEIESLDSTAVLEVRILDVGAGLCNIIKLPDSQYVIYDAGGDAITNGNRTLAQIKEHIPSGAEIELFVLSHTDADHIVAAGQVIRDYHVKKVLWSGYERSMISGNPTAAYTRLIAALNSQPNTENVNLNEADSIISPGTTFQVGSATFTFLCGFGEPLDEWELDEKGEKLNSVSIVMKLEFAGNSVLFRGDAVGRHRDDPEEALIATEKFLVENAGVFLKSTVIIAPHHGARNGSSQAFVDSVQPKAVIFSAGHKFFHPDTRTTNQYLRYVETDQIFRTDRGDDEGGTEWFFTRMPGCMDRYNDDDIQIQLRSNNTYRVFYVNQESSCLQ